MTYISKVTGSPLIEEQELEDSSLLKQLLKNSKCCKEASKLSQKQPAQESLRSGGAQLGTLFGFSNISTPLIKLPECGELCEAISTIPLNYRMTGRTVVLLFEHSGAERPIIIGLLPDGAESSLNETQKSIEKDTTLANSKPLDNLYVTADGETCILQAKREIQLRCGDASITLTRAGKVIIKGQYVLSRSKGANKIKGAYIDIN